MGEIKRFVHDWEGKLQLIELELTLLGAMLRGIQESMPAPVPGIFENEEDPHRV